MDELLELIKNTESFKKYVELVEENSNLASSDYEYAKDGTESNLDAMISLANIDRESDMFSVRISTDIGKSGTLTGDEYGYANYLSVCRVVDDNIVMNGKINAVYNVADNRSISVNGAISSINDVVANEEFIEMFENSASLLNGKIR